MNSTQVTSQDNQIANPTGRAPNIPTIILDSPASFTLGNAPFSVGRVFERQYSVADRVDYVLGKHTLQFGFDFSRAWDSDDNYGGADPNADVQFGSFLGSYEFSNLENFALGQYNTFSQASGNPTFAFAVPYAGFYVQDSFRALPQLTLEIGLARGLPGLPAAGAESGLPTYRPVPEPVPTGGATLRICLAACREDRSAWRIRRLLHQHEWPELPKRGDLERVGIAAVFRSQAMSIRRCSQTSKRRPSQRFCRANSPLFQASPDISLVSPQFKAPNILQASLQIEQEIDENTTFSIGTMWNHGLHLISGSAYDLNQFPLQGTTTYITCPPGATTAPCSGRAVVLPNMDNGLLTDGLINPNLGQINELISPGQNYYDSLFVQLQHRMSHGLQLQASYTLAKSIMLDGMDFNNQFDFSNTHAPSLLDQRNRITCQRLPAWAGKIHGFADAARRLSGWRLSTVMQFSSGRPYAGLLSPACTSSTLSFSNCDGASGNLNDTAFNQDTANTAGGINGGGPTPGIGLNSFYGPWLERIDVGLARNSQHRRGQGTAVSGAGVQFVQSRQLLRPERQWRSTSCNTTLSAPIVATARRSIRPAIWCPTRVPAISEPSRKSARTVCPARCSFPPDLLSNLAA